MSDNLKGFNEWIPSGESLEGLEDRDFELSVESVESVSAIEYPARAAAAPTVRLVLHRSATALTIKKRP